ncbi:MAG: hypothetical protein C5B59_04615 [Bacteroidetes bacterium]|nr:MAG: hypothetical protein C5B59_04615 [Bacteroidota bacterium]
MLKPILMNQSHTYTAPGTPEGVSILMRENSTNGPMKNAFEKWPMSAICRSLILIILIWFVNVPAQAQNCPTSGTSTFSSNPNTYYPGTQATVAVGATSITIGAVPAGYGSTGIATGDIVLIIQMQGAEINSTNTSSYGSGTVAWGGSGNTSNNLYAGQMEFAVAANAVTTAGGTLNLVAGTVNSYKASAFGTFGQYTYQVIRVSTAFNIIIGANISTPLWNGAVGGVTVINAVNQLNMNGKTISAAGAGFRGGGGMSLQGAAGFLKTDYVTMSAPTVNTNASKAEGIAGTPRYLNNNGVLLDNGAAKEGYPNGSFARGAPGNAGGGATDSDPISNDQNAGGGGGANGGIGGYGGNGWYSFGATGGRGGMNFLNPTTYAPYYSPSRLVMGGGGGAGTNNNATGTPGNGFASSGASGGGIIILNSLTIINSGTLDVSGASANNTVQIDGSGGGGAGGSILVNSNSGQAGITALAIGGTGGSNNPSLQSATQHGPGGSGGGGVIYSNGALNAASSVLGGQAGFSTGSFKPGDPVTTTHYGADSVQHNGVMVQTVPSSQLPPKMTICQTNVLPVTLIDFNATYQGSNLVEVDWSTSRQINANYFEIERSTNAINFTSVGQVSISQSSDDIHNYTFNDYTGDVNSKVFYYRLKIVDMNGTYTYSKIAAVQLSQSETKISLYPNPASDFAVLNLYSEKQGTALMRLIDDAGRQVMSRTFNLNEGSNSLMIDQLTHLAKGIYVVQLVYNNNIYNQKLVKK